MVAIVIAIIGGEKMKKIELIQLLLFIVFVIGLSSLVLGTIYNERVRIIGELSEFYLSVMSAPLEVQIAGCIATITVLSFMLFIYAFTWCGDEE